MTAPRTLLRFHVSLRECRKREGTGRPCMSGAAAKPVGCGDSTARGREKEWEERAGLELASLTKLMRFEGRGI